MAYIVPDQEHCLRASNLPNFAVWIEIDGQAVPVYSQTDWEDSKIATGYIESEEGKHFVVRLADLRTSPPQESYSARVFVDGEYCQGVLNQSHDWLFNSGINDSSRFRSFSGKKTSQATLHPFIFSKLQVTDNDALACTEEHVLDNLGSIKIVYRRITNVHLSGESPRLNPISTKQFDEKTKKAQFSHQVAFGPAVPRTSGRSRWSFDWVDDQDHPFQIFEFRYRSRQLLQIEGHLPNSPISSPSSSSSVEILEDRGRDAEIARLQKQIDALKNGTASASPGPSGTRKVKSEDEGGREKKRVKKEKKEDTSSSAGKGKGKEKEVIVLSDSD